ncbi:hypothetical protein N7534_005034 [Penicillium rubens]|jgi:hypothetical protein|nr:hypothetical protein N7534_005034 [Penicillium rubens]
MVGIQALRSPHGIPREEVMAERVIAKARAAARKRQRKETVNKAPEQGPPGADEWDSEAYD